MNVATEREFSRSARAPQDVPTRASRAAFALTAGLALITIVCFVLHFVNALQWRERPFMGAMVTHTLMVDGTLSLSDTVWPAQAAGLARGDHIVALNEQRLAPQPTDYAAALASFHRIMAAHPTDQPLTIDFIRTAGQPCSASAPDEGVCRITLQPISLPVVDFIGLFIAPYLTGLISLIIGVAILALRPHQPTALLVSAITFFYALALSGMFDINTMHALIPATTVAAPLLGASLITLALIFPLRSRWLYRQPWLTAAPGVVGVVAALGLLLLVHNPPYPTFQSAIPIYIMIVLGVAFLVVRLIDVRANATSATVRDQSNTILIGLALSCAPIVLWLLNLIAMAIDGVPLLPFNTSAGSPFGIIAPLSIAYAVLHYRLNNSDRVLSYGVTYAIMLLALITGYALLVFSASLFFTQPASFLANNPLLIGVTIFVIALLFLPVRHFLQGRIDRLFFRTRIDYQDRVEIFTHDISRLSDFDRVAAEFCDLLDETVAPGNVFIFTHNRQMGGRFTAVGAGEKTDISFDADSGIVTALLNNDQLLYLEPHRQWPFELRAEAPRISILNALVILGLHGSQQLIGFICIGPPRSGTESYTYEELFFLQNLAGQMAIAAERAQVIQSLERRVRELDVLSQVSQAANFTIDFDDLLELISAQTDKLVDAAYFYIVLLDERAEELYFAFFLEGDERYREKEDRRWAIGRDLYSAIVRSGQPLRTANFAGAMAQRGAPILFEDPDLKSWMGVPMIAGPRTLGVMAVATTRASHSYSDDQFKVFADITALAATSIEKARLFEETNKRARQLAALNDISHQLASELDIQKLMTLVTRSAVDILEAEAGSLLLMTDDGKELEFKVAIGAGEEMIGKRFPAKRGLAGEVAARGKPILVNNAAQDPRWAGEMSDGAFRTHTLLAVPLLASNATVGVLEVINKKNGGIFVDEDANLLTTFAGQAAIAIENARLFQMTDQQLSARVDELQALERIDVELNRSLDLKKVADITMRWAIANSGATAGVLGLVAGDPPQLQVIARYGYEDDDFPEGAEGAAWPLDRGIVRRVMRTRQPDIVTDVTTDPDYVPSLRGALSQITVPMISGGEINGLLILETNKEPRLGLVDMAFVQRLTEHANVALINAQLYVDLARANDSKSEFVSFVAHELKTPMTSIKGYTDLLLGGMVGTLNESQINFLGTIRANIERMNTLVSDLNDVTKMETNNLRMEFTPTDFRAIVTETLRPLQKQIEDREQTLIIDLPEDLPAIHADQNRLIQVLTNLVSNAHKYTPRAGRIMVRADVAADQWGSNGHKRGQVLHVQVIDSGIGMSQQDLAKLFTPYFRSDNPLAREQPGTGLGLTITRGIIERHGGSIWVESVIQQGTTFHFTVPLATEFQPEASQQPR